MTAHGRPTLALLTPTWRGDLQQFELLRRALRSFGHAKLTHHVIVQTEDIAAFRHLETDGVRLHTTADVLPIAVEQQRLHCAQRTRHWSRHAIRLARSVNKRTGWANWVRYEGWQTQQLCKLLAGNSFEEDVFVVLDSDCLPTGPYDFAALCHADGQCTYLENWSTLHIDSSGLDYRWARSAHMLLGLQWPSDGRVLNRLGTPYVLHRAVLAALLQHLAGKEGDWISALMGQPPKSWSEFALYNAFVQHLRPPQLRHRLATQSEDGVVAHDASHMAHLPDLIHQAFSGSEPGFMRIQSDARDKGQADTQRYADLFAPYLKPL